MTPDGGARCPRFETFAMETPDGRTVAMVRVGRFWHAGQQTPVLLVPALTFPLSLVTATLQVMWQEDGEPRPFGDVDAELRAMLWAQAIQRTARHLYDIRGMAAVAPPEPPGSTPS